MCVYIPGESPCVRTIALPNLGEWAISVLSYSGNVSIVLTWYLISTKEMEGENYSPSHLQHSRRKRKIGQVEVWKNEEMGGYCHHPLEADTTLNPVLLKAPRARYCSKGSPPSYLTYPPRISLKLGT